MVKMMATRKMSHRALVMDQEHPVRAVLRQKQSPPDHLLETAGTQWLARAFFWRQKKPETVATRDERDAASETLFSATKISHL